MRKLALLFFMMVMAFASGLENLPALLLSDKNKDGIYDSSSYSFVLNSDDLIQLAVASELAYRLGFESGEYIEFKGQGERKIIIKRNRSLPMRVGSIFLEDGDLMIEGNDNRGLLAVREFFWRWPYVWKVGNDGITWRQAIEKMEKDLRKRGIKVSLELVGLKIKSKVPPFAPVYLQEGEILQAVFKVRGDFSGLEKFIKKLKQERKRGQDPYVLNFPYIKELVFWGDSGEVSLPRWGAPEELFRPSYGVFFKKKKRKVPKLFTLFSSSLALILEKRAGKGAISFAFRAGLEAERAYFPFVYASDKALPPERTAVVIGKGNLWDKHMARDESQGFCLEKGEDFWYLSSDCAEEFSKAFLFPALNRERNLFYSKFFLEKMRFWLPPQAQKILSMRYMGKPYIYGNTYGKIPVYSKTTEGKDEAQVMMDELRKIKYTKALAYLSEGPQRRKEIEKALKGKVRIRSTYKTGFFWIKEEVLPKIKGADRIEIHVRKVEPGKKGEIVSSPNQFLYELYPIDEVISKTLKIPLERIEFVIENNGPLYKVNAFKKGKSIGEFTLDPPLVRNPFPRVSGWVFAWRGKNTLLSKRIRTDPEKAWEFYTKKFLPWLERFIIIKTHGKITWDKQPFFSFIEIDFEAPEPDFPLGIDKEIISSTEALHDELYFYTLYYISRLLKPTDEGGNLRSHLYPGAILPYIKTRPRGFKFTVRVYDYRKPGVYLRNIQKARFYPEGKVKYEIIGWDPDRLWVEFNFDKAEDFILYSRGFSAVKEIKFPENLVITLKYKGREKTYFLEGRLPDIKCGEKVNWAFPLSPSQTVCISRKIKYSYPIGESFLGRIIYAVEKITATGPMYSPSHFIREKPTILFNARQHANEVSSTSYLLKCLMSKTPRGVNFAAIPMENPDGAAIALSMIEKESPLHSLHAGRYNALGSDIGFHIKDFFPYAPAGFARSIMKKRWRPDVFLNLHGYPSHEWVQQFTGYLPFPYRNYWIPRGHFFYFSSVENPLNKDYSQRSLELLRYLARELSSDKRIRSFNEKLYGRYYRWAERWNPHAFRMERVEGYNIYWKENRKYSLTARPPISSEVPEYMDETAEGKFLDYLVYCGEKFIKAHVNFLLTHSSKPFYIAKEGAYGISIRKLRTQW